jgi:hypothetical protein
VVGGQVRRHLGTTAYTAICHSTCAVVLPLVCLVGRVDLGRYTSADWARIVAVMVFANLLGHSLFTVPLATALAALMLRQTPPRAAVPALAPLLAGTALVIRARNRSVPVAAPAE